MNPLMCNVHLRVILKQKPHHVYHLNLCDLKVALKSLQLAS